MKNGSVLVVPICSQPEFDEAFQLMYTVNCENLWKNHLCGHGGLGTQLQDPSRIGKQLSCGDFQFEGLERLGFVPGFFVLEKQDSEKSRKALGNGNFLKSALLLEAPPTDKVTSHAYQLLYERYLPAKRRAPLSFLNRRSIRSRRKGSRARRALLKKERANYGGRFLEIGLGCKMKYGAGKSARLWRGYFKDLQVEFLENDRLCVEKWHSELVRLDVVVHVGDQQNTSVTRQIAEQVRAPGYEIIVDDGAHLNSAIRSSFENLWPAVAPGGYYVIEDMGMPAFSYLDCEPLAATDQKQTRTALAMVVDRVRPLVLAQGGGLSRAECHLDICLLQKAGAGVS